MAEIDHAERLRKRNEQLKSTLVGGAVNTGVQSLGRFGSQIGEAASQADLGGEGSGANAIASGLGYIGDNMRRSGSQLMDYFTSPTQADTASVNPVVEQVPARQTEQQVVQQIPSTNNVADPLGETPPLDKEGYKAYNNQYAFKQDPNGGALQIKDGSGSGTIDFGSPELNAKYAKKMRKSKGTVNYMDTSKFGDSVASDTAGKIVQAVRDGNISPQEGLRLHNHALRNTDFRQKEVLDQQRQQAELTRLGKSSPSKPEKIYTPFVDNESGQTRFLNETSGFTKGKEIEQQQGRTKRVMKAYTQANPEEKQKIIMRYPELFGG